MREDQQKLIGKRLKQLRQNLGFSQTELARQLRVPGTEVDKIEQGKISLDLFPLLGQLLHLLEGALLKQCLERKEKF